MHSNILIPVAIDHEQMAARKIEVARKMLSPNGRITLLTVLERVSGFVAEFVTIKSENHLNQKILDRLTTAADGAPDIEVAVVNGKPEVEILRYAKAHDTDLIIVGSVRPGESDYKLGSTASRVVRRATTPVYVLR